MKVMSNNNHISGCSFSVEIPAYLYGEIGKREKSEFETHLSDCSKCIDELADLSFARFSVQEWRDAEFAHLETPLIKIPYERKNISDSTVSDSWLARLRQFVPLSPAWAAGGAMAALVIGVGLVLFAANVFQPAEIASVSNDNTANISVSPTTKIAVQQPEDVFSDIEKTENTAQRSPKPSNKNTESVQPVNARENKASEESKNTVVRVSENSPKNKSEKQISAGSSTNNRDNHKTAINPAPSKARQVRILDNYEEEEDNTLRLAELFEEIDTDK